MQNLIEVMNGSTVAQSIDDTILYGGVDYESVVNTAYDIRIGGIQNKRISFTCDLNNNTLDEGTHLVYKVKRYSTDSWVKVGDFYVDSNTRSDGKTRVTAFDITRQFDVDINDFLDAQTYPITVSSLFSALCTYFGCSSVNPSINASYSIPERPLISNGQKLLKAIAEVCAGYIYVQSATGNLAVGQFPTPSAQDLITYTNNDYRTFEIDDEVEEIDKVVCGTINGDIESTATSTHGVYKINFNPLLFNNPTASAVQTVVDNIRTEIVNVGVPYPCRAYLFDLLVPSGDAVIYAGLQVGISTYKTRVFSIYCNASGCGIESTGGVKRQDTTITQEEENGIFSSQIKKSEKEISTKVSQVDYNGNTIVSMINQTATNIDISASKINLNGYTDINGYFSVSNDGKVTMKDCIINVDSAVANNNYIKINGLRSGTTYSNTISSRGFESKIVGTNKRGWLDYGGVTLSDENACLTGSLLTKTNVIPLHGDTQGNVNYGQIELATYGANDTVNYGHAYLRPDRFMIEGEVSNSLAEMGFTKSSNTHLGYLILNSNYDEHLYAHPNKLTIKDDGTATGHTSAQSIITPTDITVNGTNPFTKKSVTWAGTGGITVANGSYYIRWGNMVVFTIKISTAGNTVSARTTITRSLPRPVLSCGFIAVNYSTGQQNPNLTIYLNQEQVDGEYVSRLSNIGSINGDYMITGCYIAQ